MNIFLTKRIRASDLLTIYVSPNGTDEPEFGLCYGTAGELGFKTPGYAIAWCNANLDAAGYPIKILIDGNATYSSNPVPGNCGGIQLYDVIGTTGSWTQSPITISGALNGIEISDQTQNSSWPLLSFNGIAAIAAVGVNTVWNIQYLQLQSTIADILSDRKSKINVKYIAHGAIYNGYPSPVKYSSIYGSSIEILGPVWINTSGSNLWALAYNSDIIGIGSDLTIMPGVSFTSGYTSKDNTSSLAIPTSWPK